MARKRTGARSVKKQTSKVTGVGLPPDHKPDAFKPVAELIAPNPPDWLAEHLWRWSSTVYLSRGVERRQPTRAEMVKILTSVRDAAGLLRSALGESSICEFLNAASSEPLDSPAKFQMILGELQIRADRASKLPNLVNKTGKVKAGPGHAQPEGAIPTQAYCALLIAEAWKYFNEEYPAPRNKRAAKAIELYWRLTVGARQSWGTVPPSAWRYHLERAASIPAEQERAELRRHMRESARQADFLKSGAALKDGK